MGKKKKKKEPTWQAKLHELVEGLEANAEGKPQTLRERLVSRLRIPCIGPARHVIRSDKDDKSEFFPDRVWSVSVMPSFHSHGLIAVFEGRSHVRCAIMCKGNLPDKPDADFALVDRFLGIEEWDDPILPAIGALELAPTPDRSLSDGNFISTLDGIGYMFEIETHDISASLRFSNPRAGAYRKLERGCFEAAKRIAKEADDPQVSNFLKTWRSYLRRGQQETS